MKENESYSQLVACFLNELHILRQISNMELPGRFSDIRILLASACATGSALSILGNDIQKFYTEMIMLTRSYLEKTVNFCYLNVCSDEELRKFLFHPFYRSFHNLKREKHANGKRLGVQFNGREQLKSHPSYKKALELFSESNPRMSWSSKSIDEKVALIEEKAKVNIGVVLMNTLTIYSDASESLHGSLYGCSYHLGVYDPNFKVEGNEINKRIFQYSSLLFAQLSTLTHEVIRLMNNKYKIERQFVVSDETVHVVVDLLKVIFGKKNDKGE